MSANPWLQEPDRDAAVPQESPQRPQARFVTPQSGVTAPSPQLQLGFRAMPWPAPLWILGVHGGAGESTLASMLGYPETGHAWPRHPDGSTAPVLLVARSSMSGLLAAQRAIQTWASGRVPFARPLGLVVMADIPARRPKVLRDTLHLIAGGVPQSWSIPYIDQLRTAEAPPSLDSAPKDVRALDADLKALITDERFTS